MHAQHTGRDPARIDHSSIGSVEKAARGTTSRFSTPAAQPAPSDTVLGMGDGRGALPHEGQAGAWRGG